MQYMGFVTVYDALMADVDYAAWADYIASFIPGGSDIAECGCGTGSVTLRLAKLGYRVTGLDVSPAMLAEAAKKARAFGLNIPFICQDMRALALHRPVGAVVCACDGVNYLTSVKAMAQFFRAAHAALMPGGLLLFDISSRYKLQNVLGCNTFGEDDGERAYIWRNVYDDENKLINMELSFFIKRGELFERFTESHVQRAHSEKEVQNALLAAGFCDIQAYGAFTKAPPQADTERIQFAARRAE